MDLAELYVNTFDFSKKTNLYLSYYRNKDQKERGASLLAMKQQYAKAGFVMQSSELPDFLPIVLEFTSALGTKEILMEYASVIEEVYKHLSKDNNPYSYILEAVLLLISAEVNYLGPLEESEKSTSKFSTGGGIR